MVKKAEMSKGTKIVIVACVVLLLLVMFFVGAVVYKYGYNYGLSQCKPCPKQSEVQKKPVIKKKVAKRRVTAAVPAPRVMALETTIAPQLILRINVVEWSSEFSGKSLMSRDIGPVIRQGLANGTVARTKAPYGFKVNGREVVVQDGQTIINPSPIGPETALIIQPVDGKKFASPPDNLPFITNPGELNALVARGTSEIWLNFVLAPKT